MWYIYALNKLTEIIVGGSYMTEIDYRDNDDLYLYDSVIESLELNHRDKSITFHILKVIDRVDRNQGFTYKVKQ